LQVDVNCHFLISERTNVSGSGEPMETNLEVGNQMITFNGIRALN